MIEQLHVEARAKLGKQPTKRLRAAGQIPGVLYGHGEASVSLSLPKAAVAAVIRHGTRVVQLSGAVQDSAIVKDVQWDPIGVEVLHVDLARVDRDEKVRLEIRLEMKGDAIGARQGGILELVMHELEIECPVVDLPDRLIVNVSGLEVGKAILASAIELPPNARLLTDPEAMVVHCVLPQDEEEGTTGPAEPELIAKKVAAAEDADEKK